MIKFLIEKVASQLVSTEVDSYFSLYDYAVDALGVEYGDKEYSVEYS